MNSQKEHSKERTKELAKEHKKELTKELENEFFNKKNVFENMVAHLKSPRWRPKQKWQENMFKNIVAHLKSARRRREKFLARNCFEKYPVYLKSHRGGCEKIWIRNCFENDRCVPKIGSLEARKKYKHHSMKIRFARAQLPLVDNNPGSVTQAKVKTVSKWPGPRGVQPRQRREERRGQGGEVGREGVLRKKRRFNQQVRKYWQKKLLHFSP